MEDLKEALTTSLTHVRTVWFDEHGNWYVQNVRTAVKSMTREEILGTSKKEEPETKPESGKKHKK